VLRAWIDGELDAVALRFAGSPVPVSVGAEGMTIQL
jgi:hypothetical protein